MIIEGRKNYLKVAEVQGGEVITFLNEGEWITSIKFTYDDGRPKVDFVVKVSILEVEKELRLNATNREVLVRAYGRETSQWIGKQATIQKVKALISGQMKDIIVLEV